MYKRKKEKEKEVPVVYEKKDEYVITAREMAALDDIKKEVLQQASFLQKFKTLNSSATHKSSKKLAPFGIASSTTTNAAARRTLIDRQKEYTGTRIRSSLSPD